MLSHHLQKMPMHVIFISWLWIEPATPSFCGQGFPALMDHTLKLWATSYNGPLPSLSCFCRDERSLIEMNWSTMLAWRWGHEGAGWYPSGTPLVSWISQNHFPPSQFLKLLFQLAVLSMGPHPGKFYQIHWVIYCTYFRKPEIAGWDRKSPLGQIHPNTCLIKSLPFHPAFLTE